MDWALPTLGWFLQILKSAGPWAFCLLALWFRTSYASKADLAAQQAKADKQHDDLESRVEAIEGKDQVLDERLKGLATKGDVADLLTRMERQDGDRRELAANVKGIDALLTRLSHPIDTIYKHMLNEGKS